LQTGVVVNIEEIVKGVDTAVVELEEPGAVELEGLDTAVVVLGAPAAVELEGLDSAVVLEAPAAVKLEALDSSVVVLEALVAVELEELDTADVLLQLAEQMMCSMDPVVKPVPRELVQMGSANVVDGLDTVLEAGFDKLEVEAARLEQEGREMLVVGKGSRLDVVTEPLIAAESLPVQRHCFLMTGSQFLVVGALQDGAVFPQFPACRA
jgi:hypothetical protein